ncbi:STAS domain-containing protein [Ruminococcus albus]|uniref:Anti-sigma factor antagonist n=1 Tax=Ruminococcus albus SY3 TaxID=1341156 RepID=A0A011WU94_RUMAL|nr:STAS domain-containing protein [Ruminococcus albus]EXM40570.1 anti-sigma-factor antagonist [Ruminococcus albus SY3]
MINISTTDGVTLAKLSGDLDHHTARLMRTDIDRELAEKRPRRLVIDFSSVTFMDSSGIGLIMGRYRIMNEQGGDVIVARPPAYIKKVLRLAGVDKLAPITDDPRGIIPKDIYKEKEAEIIEQTAPQTT